MPQIVRIKRTTLCGMKREAVAMGRAQREPLRAVQPGERATLQGLVRASSARVDRVRRAWALLAVAEGAGFATAAQAAGFASPTSVAELVRRFNRRGVA